MTPTETQAFNQMRDALQGWLENDGSHIDGKLLMRDTRAALAAAKEVQRPTDRDIAGESQCVTDEQCVAIEVQPQAQGEAERFNCPECRHSFNVADELERPRLECPVCGHEPINENLNHPNPAHPQASEPAPTHDQLVKALAECRDLVPVPPLGVTIEAAWREAIADPLAVPALLREYLKQPAGWKLVPVEPTPEMVDAAFVGVVEDQDVLRQLARRRAMRKNYEAMLAAAPEATT